MRRHAKAPSSGSSTPPAAGLGRAVRGALALALTLVAFGGIGASAAVADNLPTVSAETASEVGVTTAKLSGKVNPNGEAGTGNTTWRLQYSPAGDEAWSTANEGTIEAPATEEAADVDVEAIVGFGGELQPGASYEFRLQAENGAGPAETATPYPTFTMDPATAPVLTATAATALAPTTAILHGQLNPEGGNENAITSEVLPIQWQLQYSLAGQDDWKLGGQGTIEGAAATGTAPIALEAAIPAGALQPNSGYEARLVAFYASPSAPLQATSAGSNPSFTTPTAAPVVATGTNTPDPQVAGKVLLRGYVNPRNSALTDCHFEYGTTTAYGQSATCEGTVGTVDEPVTVTASSSGLTPGVTYHFRLVATNGAGTAQSADAGFLVPAVDSPECPNAGLPGAAFLSDCRAWEMVSPADKAGSGIGALTSRTRAAADGSAATFLSVTPFGDARGTSVETEYMAEREGLPGTPGWDTHAITPPQEPMTFNAITAGLGTLYSGDFSPDLSTGVVRTWSPLTDDPNVAKVENLYLRRDLRDPGPGTYSLVSGCPACAGTPLSWEEKKGQRPYVAGTSADFHHVLFESSLNLTGTGAGETKLYASDDGSVRLVGMVPPGSDTSCTGSDCVLPSLGGGSIAGLGASFPRYTPRVISLDGSLVNFTAPTVGGSLIPGESDLYQSDSHGTTTAADDTIRKLDVSERIPPDSPQGAVYQTASVDGSRVFFTSHKLTNDAQGKAFVEHLYMWHSDFLDDEVQKLTIEATGGQFRLVLGGEETADLPFDATPAQIEAALEALPAVSGADGEIAVSGGIGDATGSSPYLITFEGGLAETDEPTMTTAPGITPLSGAGATATATVAPWVMGGGHLTLLDRDSEPGTAATPDTPRNVSGVIGASTDGSRVYFVAQGQLVAGEPLIGASGRAGIYLWDEGEISYIGNVSLVEAEREIPVGQGVGLSWEGPPMLSRISPDGGSLLFGANDGSGLTAYDHNTTGCGGQKNQPCKELYVYSADTGELVCASCNPSAAPASADATNFARNGEAGVSAGSSYLNHSLSDDGRRVFFSSAEALVPEDTNGKVDAYEYDVTTGTVHLISSGTSSFDSYYLDASPSGDDVFFTTKDKLVGWDPDTSYDLYDARVDGGLPEPLPTAAPCQGESCRSGAVPTPPAPPVGSGQPGPGNRTQGRKPCPKGKRAVSGKKGKARCVKKHRKHHRTANSNRRAGR